MTTQPQPFTELALMGREGVSGVQDTLRALKAYLLGLGCTVSLQKSTVTHLPESTDLLIVVGGDGSLLNASHIAVQQGIPVLGINRGRLGFLTDIPPDDFEKIADILAGNYELEHRFLLETRLSSNKAAPPLLALNDTVLLPGDIAQLIEFNLYVNDRLVCHHRADGIIVATPTGSTAYALSGGGPILHPSLEAIVLLPMFPHTLSSRPIVVDSNSEITLETLDTMPSNPHLSCDGQPKTALPLGCRVSIKRCPTPLKLIHPKDYSYFHTLREKLNWEKHNVEDYS